MTSRYPRISRRSFLAQSSTIAVGAMAMCQTVAIAAEADNSLYVGSEPQMLLDDWLVERAERLKRTLHQPQKQGLIKEADGRDWEVGDSKIVVGPLHQGGKFHMVYRCMWWDPALQKDPHIGIDKAHWHHAAQAYATSDDGIHWHKPQLGLVDGPTGFRKLKEFPFAEPTGISKQNNFGCPIDHLIDLEASGKVSDPNKRFLLRVARRDGTSPFAKVLDPKWYYSPTWPDFVNDARWQEKLTPATRPPAPEFVGPPRGTICGFDHASRQWISIGQSFIPDWLKRNGRDICGSWSPNLREWSQPQVVLPVASDESREPTDWVEYMELTPCRIGGPETGVWLGQLVIFRGDRTSREYEMPTIPNVWRKGLTEVRLVLSRDAGHTWQRLGDKQVWIPHHEEDNGFDRLAFQGQFIRVGDELRLYYMCFDGEHLTFFRNGDPYYPDRMRVGRTAWAKLRIDGFVSLDADNDGGQLLTKPLRFVGEKLLVNLVAPQGQLRVELQDQFGKPLEGFAMEDSISVSGDGLTMPVGWRGSADLAQHSGRPVRLQFDLKNGSLYSFQFA